MEQDTTKVTRLIVFAFWCVVLIGIPFWWKTTEVYRANLPFAEIESWQKELACDFIMPTKFTIFIPKSQGSLTTSEDVSSEISNRLSFKMSNSQYKNNFPVEIAVKEWNQVNVDEHDDIVGNYFIYVDVGNKIEIQFGSKRTSHLKVVDASAGSIGESLSNMIYYVYLGDIEKLGNTACHLDSQNKNDVSSMRAFKYSSQYETTFSLMNNNPENMKVDWDIREAVNSYLGPFLRETAVVSNFSINTQIQNYAPLSLKPKYKERVGKPSYYYFEPHHLPHFVNSAEWNLASTITSHPSINFVLYIPSAEESPLRIHDSKDQPLLTSAFLIPRWGGIVIKNPPRAAQDEYRFTKKDLQPIMKIFISQLRSLIGVRDLETEASKYFPANYHVVFEPAKVSGITTLEKDNLIRTRTLENSVNTISTLKSLAQLVDEIPNMVVQDHISIKIRQSLDALDSISSALKKEQYLEAFQSSIKAIDLAEKAFFDPTMVSMLYFPDEHKYAIYMPLFVPISVPLIMAVLKEIKKSKEARKEKQKTQ